MADAWRDDRLTMQTLRDVYANLNHAEPGAAAAAGWPAARREPEPENGGLFSPEYRTVRSTVPVNAKRLALDSR